MPTYRLLDVTQNHVAPAPLAICAADVSQAIPQGAAWSVTQTRLQGGRRDGVDSIHVNNGRLSFTVLPTRGLGIWVAHDRDDRVGWVSPIADGPVHPALVNLAARGGLGWLQGFDELMARCGLESNGPPVFRDGNLIHGLHGRIANTPAHKLMVHVEDQAPHTITISAEVDETELFFGHWRLASSISTVPGSNRLVVRDEIRNLREANAGFQLLYHWNFGAPQLEAGARFHAAVREVCPSGARAAEGIGHYDTFGPPEHGFAEQVYFFTLAPDEQGRTVVLLRNRAADKGVALRFDTRQLPCFTLWKCTQGMSEGYVTGLEPGINYPNPRAFEELHGRIKILPPGGSHIAETELETLANQGEVAAVMAEIDALQRRAGAPIIHGNPTAPFALTNS